MGEKTVSNFFLAKYCTLSSTQFLWIGSAYQFRVEKWITDTVHTKENLVCCQIDSFSLVLHSHNGGKIPQNKPHSFSSGKQSYPSPPLPSPRKIILNSAWA